MVFELEPLRGPSSSAPTPHSASSSNLPTQTPRSRRHPPRPVPVFLNPLRRGSLQPPGSTTRPPGGPALSTSPSSSRSPSSPQPRCVVPRLDAITLAASTNSLLHSICRRGVGGGRLCPLFFLLYGFLLLSDFLGARRICFVTGLAEGKAALATSRSIGKEKIASTASGCTRRSRRSGRHLATTDVARQGTSRPDEN